MASIEWPMDLLTKEAGETRKLVVKPKSLVGRNSLELSDGSFLVKNPGGIKFWYPSRVYVETKEQGHFHFLARDSEWKYHVYGRRLNVYGEYADIYDKLEAAPLPEIPPETVLAFELVWPGHPDSSVPTAIKQCPEQLRAIALGVPIYCGRVQFGITSIDYLPGRELMEKMVGAENCVEYLGYEDVSSPEDLGQLITGLLLKAKEECTEGYVFKTMHYVGWWKLKVIRDVDLFILDFKISDAETRTGLVTSVEVGVMDVDGSIASIGSVSGFELEEMERMTNDMAGYKNRVLRVIYQELA